MAVPAPTKPVLRFGAFEVDLDAGEVRKNGFKLKLQDQPFQVLSVLLQRPHQVVSREELRKQLWPMETFVDFDNGLNKAVARLRDLLTDSVEVPRYIETVPRKGYRFIYPVEGKDVQASSSPADHERRSSGLRSQKARWAVVALGIISVAVVYVSYHERAANSISMQARVRLAVLPFANLTGDPGQEYFSDGLTEEIITELGGGLPESLAVIARTSAMHYKGSTARVAQIGQELGIDYLMEGSVRRQGTRVRISVQLIRVRDESHIWAQDYDGEWDEYLALEGRIANDVARHIQVQLTPSSSASAHHVKSDAHEAYLKGTFFWNQRFEGSYLRAIAYFKSAIAKDPEYPQAYAGLANSYALLGSNPTAALSRPNAMAEARSAATHALALDDRDAEAHTSLAFIYWHYDWDWPAAEREFLRAITLNPSYATAHHWYAFYLLSQGRSDAALQEIRRAQELDPLSSIINTDVGEILFRCRRFDEAITQERTTLEMNPSFALAWGVLARSYAGKRDYDSALEAYRKGMNTPGGDVLLQGGLAETYALMGQTQTAHILLEGIKNMAETRHMDELYMSVALAYSALGDKEDTFLWLERDHKIRDGALTLIKVIPALDWLHSDPRYSDLVRRIGLPP